MSHTSLLGDESSNLHPAVQEFVGLLPSEQRDGFDGRCAESILVSDQLWRLDAERDDGRATTMRDAIGHFEGAVMTSRLIRPEGDPNHGKPAQPCAVCAALLDALYVQFVG
ncbi:YwqJ-related putative deaminase [Streptomyces typhae]|uniref:YwqJ-related putative deaminase n=1 Tax=Streptomyces typhae TaxID=2681492 RepID=UPI0031B5C103